MIQHSPIGQISAFTILRGVPIDILQMLLSCIKYHNTHIIKQPVDIISLMILEYLRSLPHNIVVLHCGMDVGAYPSTTYIGFWWLGYSIFDSELV